MNSRPAFGTRPTLRPLARGLLLALAALPAAAALAGDLDGTDHTVLDAWSRTHVQVSGNGRNGLGRRCTGDCKQSDKR